MYFLWRKSKHIKIGSSYHKLFRVHFKDYTGYGISVETPPSPPKRMKTEKMEEEKVHTIEKRVFPQEVGYYNSSKCDYKDCNAASPGHHVDRSVYFHFWNTIRSFLQVN